MKKIDIFNHVMPPAYLELVKAHSKEPGIVKRMSSLRMLWDIEHRVAMLREQFPEVQQVLTLGLPAPELIGDATQSPAFARVANDGMADMVRHYPKEFPAFVASLPMNNVPAALDEMDRAISTLGARGIQIISSVAGRPLDDPEFFPVFERATRHHDVPIWMHPARPATRADYAGEPKSRYEIWQVLGWPYETSAAMARIAHGIRGPCARDQHAHFARGARFRLLNRGDHLGLVHLLLEFLRFHPHHQPPLAPARMLAHLDQFFGFQWPAALLA